jgi:hypothetical protein
MLTLSTGVNLTGVNLNYSQINVDNSFANLPLKLTIYLMKSIPEPDQQDRFGTVFNLRIGSKHMEPGETGSATIRQFFENFSMFKNNIIFVEPAIELGYCLTGVNLITVK